MGRACLRIFLLGGVLLAAFTQTAQAEELPEGVRKWVERAFLEGRPEAIDEILADQPRGDITYAWPLLVRDHWWRLGPREPKIEPTSDARFQSRMRWLAASLEGSRAPFPDLDPQGGRDPYPILTALIRDRIRRETRGYEGLPEESPLVLLAPAYDPAPEKDAYLHHLLGDNTRSWMRRVYERYEKSDEERTMERNARRVRTRNGRLAFWSLLAFVLLPILASLWMGRRAAISR